MSTQGLLSWELEPPLDGPSAELLGFTQYLSQCQTWDSIPEILSCLFWLMCIVY
jgi:hypothetical protein